MEVLHRFIVIYWINMALLSTSRRQLVLPNLEGTLSYLMPSSAIIATDSEGFS